MKKHLTLIFCFMILSNILWSFEKSVADSTTSAATIKSSAQQIEGKIKDTEVSAEIGSLSKTSLSAKLSYYGSDLEAPFEEYAPNKQGYNTDSKTILMGDLMGRYRIDKTTSVTLGVGVSLKAPFANAQDPEANDPNMAYNWANESDSISGYGYTSLKHYTNKYDSQKVGKLLKWGAGYKGKFKQVLNAPWSLALKMDVANYFFKDSYVPGDKKTTQYYINLTPTLEYQLSKSYSLKTDLKFGYTNYREDTNLFDFEKNFIEQTIGVAVSFTPTTYLYTYLQLFPEDYRFDNTILATSLTVSVF